MRNSSSLSRLPLDGIKVVDLTVWLSGSIAGMLLADMGADVIKVEPPVGEPTRQHKAPTAGLERPRDVSLTYTICNRNKRSLTLDLSAPNDRSAFEALIVEADVFVCNLTLRAMRKLAIDEPTIHAINPGIVFAHCGGFGHSGALADVPVQDMTGMAYAGMLFTMSNQPGVPFAPPGAMNDVNAGTLLGFGILAALLERARTGEGQTVRNSLASTALWNQMTLVGTAANTEEAAVEGRPHDNPRNPMLNQYRCRDGKWLALAVVSPRDWAPLLRALELEPEELEPLFPTWQFAVENAQDFRRLLDRIFVHRDAADWITRLRAEQVWCGPVNTIFDMLADPDVAANQYLAELDDGTVTVTMPFQLEGMRPQRRPGPRLGADSQFIRRRIASGEWPTVDELG